MEKDFQKYFREPILSVNYLSHRGNNKLFKIILPNRVYLLKKYSAMHMDGWERGKKEFYAVSHLWKRQIKEIAEPILFDEKENIGIYSYEEGITLNPCDVTKKDISSSIDFLVNVHNLPKEDKELFGQASSACLSLIDYIYVIDRRISRIIGYIPRDALGARAKRFLDERVCPKITELKEEFFRKSKNLNLERAIDIEEQVLTPADFGFHNILVDRKDGETKYKFVDFEYFGRDDPVRQILDFIHHDSSSYIDKRLKENFISLYKERRKPQDNFENRLHLVGPLVGMSWVLIYLNVLSKGYLEHVRFAHGTIENIFQERLYKAERKLESLG